MKTDKPWISSSVMFLHALYNMTSPQYDDIELKASIGYALNMLQNDTEAKMVEYIGHNVVGGIAQFLALADDSSTWNFGSNTQTAWDFIGGAAQLKKFNTYGGRHWADWVGPERREFGRS